MEHHQTFRLHVTPRLDSVEIDTAGEIGGVELRLVVTGVDVSIDQLGDLLAEGVRE